MVNWTGAHREKLDADRRRKLSGRVEKKRRSKKSKDKDRKKGKCEDMLDETSLIILQTQCLQTGADSHREKKKKRSSKASPVILILNIGH